MQRKVPSAITNITLNRATFTDVPIDELTFVNFFYGNNGAGKSSIAHAIADCWYTFSKELEPALESTRLAIENKDVYIVSVEDVNDEQE